MDLGRAAGEGATPAVAAWRAALRWIIVLAFLFRGGLSLLEAVSMATGAFQSVAPVSAESLASYSPFWPAIWGVLSTLTAAALVARLRTGWLVGIAVTIGYLVAGITNASAQAAGLGADPGATFFVIVIGLIVPMVMVSGHCGTESGSPRRSRRNAIQWDAAAKIVETIPMTIRAAPMRMAA